MNIVAADQIHQERLTGRRVERVDQAPHDGDRGDVPVADGARGHQRRERQPHRPLDQGRRHHDAALGQAIGDGAGRDREEQHRAEEKRADEAEPERRVGFLEDQPRLADRLHPVADDGQRLGGEEDAEVFVLEGSERARKAQIS